MSRVTFSTEVICVTAGYDRPTKGFFLSVYDFTEGDYVVHEPGVPMADGLIDALAEYGEVQAMPDGFWERVERCEGNVLHEFKDGAWTTHAP